MSRSKKLDGFNSIKADELPILATVIHEQNGGDTEKTLAALNMFDDMLSIGKVSSLMNQPTKTRRGNLSWRNTNSIQATGKRLDQFIAECKQIDLCRQQEDREALG